MEEYETIVFGPKLGNNRIMLVKNNLIISQEQDVSKEFSNQFKNAVKNLNIPEVQVNETGSLTDKIDMCTEKIKNHPSIIKINEMVGNCDDRFEFQRVNEEEVITQFKNLKDNKATTFKNIPGKILKEYADIYHSMVTNIINLNLENN